jgi:HEAT repeat protein
MPLIRALKDDDHLVRASAAEALGKLNDTSAVEPLITLLEDKDADVRRDASKALEKLNFVVAGKSGEA